MHPLDLTGQRNGKLTALEWACTSTHPTRGRIWACRCDCGNICLRPASHFFLARSCGCFRQRNPTQKHRRKLLIKQRWSIGGFGSNRDRYWRLVFRNLRAYTRSYLPCMSELPIAAYRLSDIWEEE